MKTRIILFVIPIFFLVLFVAVFSAHVSTAQVKIENPLGETSDIPSLIKKITNYVSSIVGVIAVLMFVIAGIVFITSAGVPERVVMAKKIAVAAAVGTAIALAASGLVSLVEAIIKKPPGV